ncbi:MAG: STY4526/YPO1902 family pathogenicity island replication protein [Gammaproteobacteria bacterium]|nr:STY4526/YPO1902 family pathogenicity island replication protein [Gammaproteobacteria bacterium]
MTLLEKSTKRMASTNLAVKTYQFIATNNKSALYRIGIDDATIECLKETKVLDLNSVINAFEQASSFTIQVDTQLIRQTLVSNLRRSKTDNLINQLLLSGAPFSMMRYFFKTYTNRQHTEFRKALKVNDEENVCQCTQSIPQVTDDFFSAVLKGKKEVGASDLLQLSNTKNYCMKSVWREFKIFTQNSAD